jgi:YHS domain-containing protein
VHKNRLQIAAFAANISTVNCSAGEKLCILFLIVLTVRSVQTIVTLAAALLAITVSPVSKGNTTAKINVDSQGVILKGAYFKQGKPVKGNPEIKSSYQGATYLFASAEDKADFDKDPAKYSPQYGGFCSYGVSVGVLADIEGPDGFVYKGKLYVCGNKDAGKDFNTDLDSNIEKADANWQKLSGS